MVALAVVVAMADEEAEMVDEAGMVVTMGSQKLVLP